MLRIAEHHLRVGLRPGATTTEMIQGEVVDVPLALKMDIWVNEVLPYLGRDAFRAEGPFSPTCEYCGEPMERACPACREAFYCGEEHRVAGWKDHKKRCTFRFRSRPKKKKSGGGEAKR